MGTVNSDRRLNLSFDDLDLDILEWLNSFGKRKRARVAKEALRKAMNEGFRVSPSSLIQSRSMPVEKALQQSSISSESKIRSDPVRDKPLEQVSNSTDVLDTLIDLVGIENDSEILRFLNQGKNEGVIP